MLNFIDWVITLPEDLSASYYREVGELEKELDVKYVTTFEKMGRQQGIQYGEATTLLRQMEKKFGKPPISEYRSRIESADSETLSNWLDNIITAEKPDDVFH